MAEAMGTGLATGTYVRLLVAVYAAMFLIRVAFGIRVVTFAEYLDEGPFIYSLVVTASPLLELITVVFAGVIIDRYGRKGVLLAGLGLGAATEYALALTSNPFLLAGINALHGIAAAFILVTTLAVIATFAPPEHRGREMGLFNVANLFGWIIGFTLGFILLDIFRENLAYTFIIAGILAPMGVILAHLWIQLPREVRREHRENKPAVQDLLRSLGNKQIVLLTAPWLIVFMLVGSFVTFLPRVAAQSLQLTGATAAMGLLGFAALLVASQLIWGRMADRYGHENIMLVGAVGFVLFMGLIVYAFFETPHAEPQVVFANVMSHGLLLGVLLFVTLAFAPAGLAALADEAKEGAQGTTMSVYGLTLSLGFIVGPPTLGALSATVGGTGMVLYFATLAALLFAFVMARYMHMRRLTASTHGRGG